MKVYIDSEYRCHTKPGPDLTEVETEFFNGKCSEFIEGYKLIPQENGEYVFPYKPYEVLEAFQNKYEQMQSEIKELLERYGIT